MPYPVWNTNDEQCGHNGMQGSGYGTPTGTRWCPAHCDAVLRRHYWFWDNESYSNPADLNTAPLLLGMHMTSVGRGCNMILDMSPSSTGLLNPIDSATYAAFGQGLETLYKGGTVAGNVSNIAAGTSVVTWTAADGVQPITRGALELREWLQDGQAITNYTVEYCATEAQCAAGGTAYTELPLHNGPTLTIGNRRLHFWNGTAVSGVRVSVSTLMLVSGPAVPRLRSLALFDWSNATLDPLLTKIETIA